MVATANLSTIRSDFKDQIEAITPTHTKHQDSSWSYVQDPEDIKAGAGLRAFSLTFGPPATEKEGLGTFNDGWSAVAPMRVWVSYGHVAPTDDETMMEEDAADLFFKLEGRIGTLSGLLGVLDSEGDATPPDFIVEDDEQGLVGYYDFLIRYYRRDS